MDYRGVAMKRMKRWCFTIRGNFYAYGPIEAANLADAKQWVRDWLDVPRLPAGTQVWRAE